MTRYLQRLRRPLLEFLAVPVLIVAGFVVLAELVDWLDNRSGPRHAWGPLRLWLSQYVGNTQAAIGVLSAIAGSLFTVTSITFSILLLAVQQGAAVLNSQIVDHYLRRGSNRGWFGFFVGVSLFVLITLVQTTHTSSPVFGVTISTLLGAVALIALVVLIYSTIDQTRPATVLRAIGDAALEARALQLPLLAASTQDTDAESGVPIRCTSSGYLLRIDLPGLQRALDADPQARLTILRSIGDFVPVGLPLAIISGAARPDALVGAVADALPIADQRDVAEDAGYSLHHIATIGWTAISTARSDPAVGAITVHTLQRLLHAWLVAPARGGAEARIAYHDRLPRQMIDTAESLVVAAAESRQAQSLALIVSLFVTGLPAMAPSDRPAAARVLSLAARSLPDHLPIQALCNAAAQAAATCRALGLPDVAAELEQALERLQEHGPPAWAGGEAC
ncbi:MAG: DUF2254 family protein [Janthinobacterium lividum]